MYSRSKYLLRNYTNNMRLVQLQPQEVGNISKADWFFALWYIWHQMVRSSKECKTICSSPSRRQVGFKRPARAKYHSKNQEKIHEAIFHVRSFTCIMSVIWHRILVPIDFCNTKSFKLVMRL